ncbi:MAG TPA: S1 RNA-binding domain-containing protein [Chloroflexota bacterium]|nr:S1 RNA-binding domain-containing protein [Chloroflexota bacterium]
MPIDSGDSAFAPSEQDAAVNNGSDMQDLLAESERPFRGLRRGEVVEGVVVQVGRDEILVDIGAKAEAVVPIAEIPHVEGEPLELPAVGDTITASVITPENREGHAVLSLTRAQAEQGWRELQQVFDAGQSIEGEVVNHNRGGLVVNVFGVRGFVPLSQISDVKRVGSEQEADEQLTAMHGNKMLLRVLELQRRRNRLILSERATVQERRARDKERLLQELQPGDVREGTVSSVCDFGAFVDLGGADGLVHLSELSWGQVAHPSHLVKVGDKVRVHVLSVDRDGKKIALSMKRLQPEPWALLAENYQVGQEIRVKITKLAPFGAFAEVEPGIEGLIHISELSEERIAHPKQVVREGETVPVRIIRIDAARHRLGLSLRQSSGELDFEDEPDSEVAADAPSIAGSAPDTANESVIADSEVGDEPLASGESEPLAIDEPEPVAASETQAATNGEPGSDAMAESGPVANGEAKSESEPVTATGTEPVVNGEAKPVVKSEAATQATAGVADS